MSETPRLLKKSVVVDHVCPPLSDFQNPPAGAPTYILSGSVGWNAIVFTLPIPLLEPLETNGTLSGPIWVQTLFERGAELSWILWDSSNKISGCISPSGKTLCSIKFSQRLNCFQPLPFS